MKALKILTLALVTMTIASCDNRQGGSRTFYASRCGVPLNSDVYKGGGTDATEKLQAILDKAPELGRLELVLDGAALVSKTLRIHGNTTIICPDKSCGIFLADSSNCTLMTNANCLEMGSGFEDIIDRNISLIGGVYNHNSPGHTQQHVAFDIRGIENFLVRDVTLANQREWMMRMANWKHVTMENVHIDRQFKMKGKNQDGLHFHGPGRFLTLRNIRGNAGDDFIALTPDEADKKSSIEDVLIEGLQLEESDQAIRMLCREDGRLDRVIVRDVTGTYNSFGFYINPWFWSPGGGHYGNIVFENIDLRPRPSTYNYTTPFLFKIGGHVESLTFKDIYQHKPEYNHRLFLIDDRYGNEHENVQPSTYVERMVIDGLYIDEDNANAIPDTYINIRGRVDVLSVNNVILRRSASLPQTGSLIKYDNCTVGDLLLNNISVKGLKQVVEK